MVLVRVLGQCAKAGKDKLTIVPSPVLWGFGVCLEQLAAESTGKKERELFELMGNP